jgi:hypothetical protein
MPFYTFKRKSTGEHRDVFQAMNDTHEYKGENGDEDDWTRLYHSPNASIDTQIDPNSRRQFLESTASKKGATMGEMMDYSKELSEKRAAQNGGVDPIKKKYFEDYSKKRKGAKHLDEMKSYESKNIKVDYD